VCRCYTVSLIVSFHFPAGCSPHVCTDINGQSSNPFSERSLGLLDSNSTSVPACRSVTSYHTRLLTDSYAVTIVPKKRNPFFNFAIKACFHYGSTALRCALRAIVSDMSCYSAALAISLTIARNAHRSAAQP